MLDIDDYIIGALMLYIDIIQLFLQILSILTQLFG
jgi:FtsH-binding integral membrane protein